MLADDPGYHISLMNADASLQVLVELRPDPAHFIDHAERHFGNRDRMIGLLFRQPASDHVGIADGLDLFEPQMTKRDCSRSR